MAIKRLFCTTCDREYVIDKTGYLNTPCPVCSNILLDEKPFKKCKSCEQKLEDEAVICTSCGTFVESEAHQSIEPSEEDVLKADFVPVGRKELILRTIPLIIVYLIPILSKIGIDDDISHFLANDREVLSFLKILGIVYSMYLTFTVVFRRCQTINVPPFSALLFLVPYINVLLLPLLLINPVDVKNGRLHTKEEKKAVLNRALVSLGAGVAAIFVSLVVYAAGQGVSGKAPLPIALVFNLLGPEVALVLCLGLIFLFLAFFLKDILLWTKMKTY